MPALSDELYPLLSSKGKVNVIATRSFRLAFMKYFHSASRFIAVSETDKKHSACNIEIFFLSVRMEVSKKNFRIIPPTQIHRMMTVKQPQSGGEQMETLDYF